MAENRTEIKQREYLIGDMSEIVGVSRDTLRFYEKKGIIKARKNQNVLSLGTQIYALKLNTFYDSSILLSQ